jgi:hypothetical protein
MERLWSQVGAIGGNRWQTRRPETRSDTPIGNPYQPTATVSERTVRDLKKGPSDEDAARIIYYHFRFEQFSLAADDVGWGDDRARDWIRERVEIALLDA